MENTNLVSFEDKGFGKVYTALLNACQDATGMDANDSSKLLGMIDTMHPYLADFYYISREEKTKEILKTLKVGDNISVMPTDLEHPKYKFDSWTPVVVTQSHIDQAKRNELILSEKSE